MEPIEKPYPWRFFRAGGFDQVKIETGADIVHLDQLDQKLWVALSCPIAGLNFDARTASLIDTDKDGRIRAPELIAAGKWAGSMLKDPDLLISGGDVLALADINDSTLEGRQLLGSARHILSNLGAASATAINLAQASEGNDVFARAALNGDGIVLPESTPDPALAALIREIMEAVGSVADRSGKAGIDQALADKFFQECAAFDAWMRQAETGGVMILPAGEGTAAAAKAVKEIKAKVDDYFGRCHVAAYDPRALPVLNRKEEDYQPIAAHNLTINAAEIADFPLAHIGPGQPLPFDGAVNPAFAAALAALRHLAVRPLLGIRSELTEAEWTALQAKLENFAKWQAARAGAAVEKLGWERVGELLQSGAREKINALIAQDLALAGEAAAVGHVEKLLRCVRDLRQLCQNFVNFKDLYAENTTAIFQSGVLYLDRRSCCLCLTVSDPARHAVMAGLSGAFLAYCDCVRKDNAEKLSIVAVVSQGDDDNLMVGRNGLFYDRQGRDYDATITKIIPSPISLRQAFWAPYKKLARVIEEHVAKKAAAADADVNAQLAATATATTAATTAAAPAAPAKPAFDPSVIALLSVAVGSLAAAGAAILAFLGKFPLWQLPLILAGIALLISAPSLILAYIKLRKRNLGPILDASGWAINAKASINVPFGARLTGIAHLPANSSVDTHDIYEQHAALWPKILLVLALIFEVFAIAYDTGLLYRLTRHWETPLGNPPANLRPHLDPTNNPPAVTATNAPSK
ncbi:MAG TPA: hypothetical protein VHB20_07740 [Verrucomicrobiae bacterium]|jgi:hypothetical protein|nr:hypothetical protein [Verrucomicrobiae bacterium]